MSADSQHEKADEKLDDLTYDFEFSWNSTYARAARLIASEANPGLVVDLGAGVGVLGDAVEMFDMTYLGLDGDPSNVAAMEDRGKTARLIDLLAEDAVDSILAMLDGTQEPVVALTVLDVIEHLPDPRVTVEMLSAVIDRIADSQNGAAPLLVLSVPNVAHYDLGAKLILGGWDVTRVGLLDETHISLFTERRLDETMARSGFVEVCRSDVVFDKTEQQTAQQTEPDTPTFGDTTLAAFLQDLRERGGPASQTYQFVRSYRRGPAPSVAPELSETREGADAEPFLSVILRTQGARDSLVDTLTSLAAQSDDDIEVLLMVHHDDPTVAVRLNDTIADFAPSFVAKVHLHHVVGGGRSAPLNAALTAARGRYVAILDDDDVITSDWVAAFRRAADRFPGRMVRAACVVQWIEPSDGLIDFAPVSGFEAMYPAHFNFVDTVRANRSPPCCYASPMGVVRSLGIEFDKSLRVCEDWKFELEVARVAGVSDDPAATSVYRRWRRDGGSAAAEDDQVWIDDHERVIDDLDQKPTLFPAGSLREIHELYRYVEHLEGKLGRRQPDDLPFSTAQPNISE